MSIIREYIRKKYYFRLNKRLYADGNMIILFPSAFFILIMILYLIEDQWEQFGNMYTKRKELSIELSNT